MRLLLTQGDAAGIGPETIVQACRLGALQNTVVVGDARVMRRAVLQVAQAAARVDGASARAGGLLAPQVVVLHDLSELDQVPPGCLPLIQPPLMDSGLADLPQGKIDARCGAAAALCIEYAVQAVVAGRAQGIVTAPIHKESLAAAGSPYPGHTEMLQALAHAAQGGDAGVGVSAGVGTEAGASAPPPVRMMLANEELRVVLVTIHLSLRKAIEALDFDAVLQTLQIAHQAAASWGQTKPRIAVAGLNPHAGEGGLFGDEEIRFIGPAVSAARASGLDVSGPFAPDTVFMRARRGEFDLVVAMTHDHGLIPVKYLGVEQGVNVTLGLPFVRTSPDHGTAFDIAGQGVADPSSLMAALRMARRLLSSGGPG